MASEAKRQKAEVEATRNPSKNINAGGAIPRPHPAEATAASAVNLVGAEPIRHRFKVSGLRGWIYNDPWEGTPTSRGSPEFTVDRFTFQVGVVWVDSGKRVRCGPVDSSTDYGHRVAVLLSLNEGLPSPDTVVEADFTLEVLPHTSGSDAAPGGRAAGNAKAPKRYVRRRAYYGIDPDRPPSRASARAGGGGGATAFHGGSFALVDLEEHTGADDGEADGEDDAGEAEEATGGDEDDAGEAADEGDSLEVVVTFERLAAMTRADYAERVAERTQRDLRGVAVYWAPSDKKFKRRVRDNMARFHCQQGESYECPCNEDYYDQFGNSSCSTDDSDGSSEECEYDEYERGYF